METDSIRDPVIKRIRDREPVLRFKCHFCGWSRYIANGEEAQTEKIFSPIYGKVSVKHLADLDVKNHRCEYAAEAKRKAAHARRIVRVYLRSGSVARPEAIASATVLTGRT